jgi:outer membrane protein assembly factor BamA
MYDPIYSPYIDRDLATATRSNRGVNAFGTYPLSQYRRIEISAGLGYVNESYNDPLLQDIANEYQQAQYGNPLFRSGFYVPMSVAFVQETTLFREFGPLSGSTFRIAYEAAPPIKDLGWQTIDADVRKYFHLAGSSLLAIRLRGFKSWGNTPDFMYFGGNSELRGYDYLQFAGQNMYFANAELRIPLIDAMATPIGILGGVRGVAFFGIGGAWFENSGYKFSENNSTTVRPVTGITIDPITGLPVITYGAPVPIDGFRLVGGRASYGVGLETYALGFPIHFDWSWRTLFNKEWEDVMFSTAGGSDEFRKPRFQFWIGFNF